MSFANAKDITTVGNSQIGYAYLVQLGSGATLAVTDAARTQAGMPVGGTTGQVLQKNSGTDYDVSWVTPVSTAEGIWNYSTNNTMADPGSGKYRTNTTAFSTATALAVSKLTTQNLDKTNTILQLKSGDAISIQDKANSANFARYNVTAGATNNTTWFQIPVAFVNGGGTIPNNNTDCIFTFELA